MYLQHCVVSALETNTLDIPWHFFAYFLYFFPSLCRQQTLFSFIAECIKFLIKKEWCLNNKDVNQQGFTVAFNVVVNEVQRFRTSGPASGSLILFSRLSLYWHLKSDCYIWLSTHSAYTYNTYLNLFGSPVVYKSLKLLLIWVSPLLHSKILYFTLMHPSVIKLCHC